MAESKLDALKEALVHREAEIFSYQVNIDNYVAMIATLPSEWPEELIEHKGSDIRTVIPSMEDEEKMILTADLIFHDSLIITLMTERLEQRKAMLIRDVMAEQIASLST